MSAIFSIDVAQEAQYLDLLGIAAGYGSVSVPIENFFEGDLVDAVILTIQGTSLTTISMTIDQVQRAQGYYEWTSASSISGHFTLTIAQTQAIAAATNCTYSVQVQVTRSENQYQREVQAGNISVRPSIPSSPLLVSSIIVTGGPVIGAVGDDVQLTAVAYDSAGSTVPGATVAWSSSDEDIATVDSDGLVTITGTGGCTITASTWGVSGSTSASGSIDPLSVGAIVYAATLTELGFLPIGTAAQYLKVNAGATAPEWDTITAADIGAGTFQSGNFTFGGNVLFDGDNLYDIGGAGVTRPRDAFIGRNIVVGGTTTLGGLTYTWPGSQSANKVLRTDGAGVLSWAAPTEQIALTDLTDVTITAVANGNVLRYNSGTSLWENSFDASLLTSLNATQLTSGTVPNGRLTGGYTGVTGIGTLAADLLFTDAAYDIGKTGATRPRDGFFSRNVAIGGTLAMTGAITSPGTLTLTPTGAITVIGAASVPAGILSILTNSNIVAVTPDVTTDVARKGRMLVTGYGVNATYYGYTTGGTVLNPTAITSGLALVNLVGGGFDGTAYASGGQYLITAAETWSVVAHGAFARIQTIPTGATTLEDAILIKTTTTGNTRLVPGATSVSLRNNADSADNLIIVDAGAATFRSTITSGGSLLAGTDNSFDLGALGANRYRDFYLSRNATIGGTVFAGGIFTAALGAVIAGADPSALFTTNNVTGPSSTQPIQLLRAAGGPQLLLGAVGTSFASPTAVTSGVNLGVMLFGGYDGSTTMGSGPTIIGVATETFTSTAHGSKLVFNTRANGTIAAQNVLELGQDKSAALSGNVTVGGTLAVTGATTLAATTIGGVLTYAGNAFAAGTTGATGGNLVGSASPTFTGTVQASALTTSGLAAHALGGSFAGADPTALYALGVSAPSAVTPVHILRAGGNPNVLLGFVGTSFSAPTGVSSGITLGVFGFGGYDGVSALRVGADVRSLATETWNATSAGAKLVFSTRANTTTTAQTVLTLDQDKSATFTGVVTTGGNLLAGTDASFDFGASGASRFRDGYLSRNLTVGGTLAVGGGKLTVTTGGLVGHLSTGAAPIAGNAALVGGTVTVNTTAITATSIVILTRKTSGGTIGTAITYTISAGTSFTISSDNILDTSTFSWVVYDLI